jgi:hypothetical protein
MTGAVAKFIDADRMAKRPICRSLSAAFRRPQIPSAGAARAARGMA